jgi:peptidoglycan/LPS O-acetylase OafA/YrhL
LLRHFAPELKSHLPRLRVLETLGSAALPVFCAHLVVVLTVLALLGEATTPRPLWVDALLVLVTFGVLYGVALLSAAADRRAQALKERVSARRQQRRALTQAPGTAQ